MKQISFLSLLICVLCLLGHTHASTELLIVSSNYTEHRMLLKPDPPQNTNNDALTDTQQSSIASGIEALALQELSRGDILYEVEVYSVEWRANSDDEMQFGGARDDNEGVLLTVRVKQSLTSIAVFAYEPLEITSILQQLPRAGLVTTLQTVFPSTTSVTVFTMTLTGTKDGSVGLRCTSACVGMIVMGVLGGAIIVVTFIIILLMVCCCCRSRYYGGEKEREESEPLAKEVDSQDGKDKDKTSREPVVAEVPATE